MDMTKIKYYYVFSQHLAGYLLMRGFPLLRLNTNLKDKRYKVFLFKDCEEIQSAISSYHKEFDR